MEGIRDLQNVEIRSVAKAGKAVRGNTKPVSECEGWDQVPIILAEKMKKLMLRPKLASGAEDEVGTLLGTRKRKREDVDDEEGPAKAGEDNGDEDIDVEDEGQNDTNDQTAKKEIIESSNDGQDTDNTE